MLGLRDGKRALNVQLSDDADLNEEFRSFLDTKANSAPFSTKGKTSAEAKKLVEKRKSK